MLPLRRATLVADLTLIAFAAALWLFHPPQAFLEGAYGNGLYPALQHAMTPWTNRLPFAAGDVLLVVVVGALLTAWISRLRAAPRWTTVGRLLLRTAAVAALLYAWFTLAWGWNYLREPLYRTLGYDPGAVRAVRLEALEHAMVDALNAEAPRAHVAHDGNASPAVPLANAYAAALPELSVRWRVAETHPKRTLLDTYFVATGISGMFFPFSFETYLASDVLWFEYPFDLEHEWGHLAGIARESDANFVGALATLRADDPILRYSGMLMVYGALPRMRNEDARLSKLVLADYDAIRRRDERHIKRFAFKFAWATYDKYLKTQHVQTGVVNYGEYVRLLLGTAVGRDALRRATEGRF